MAKKVIVYSAEWCHWCNKVKDFLKDNNVEFEERNVENKEYAKESFEKSGQGGIPVTDVDGTIVIGFDMSKLKTLLGLE
jgi:glutaredoxin-like YruB-family protein